MKNQTIIILIIMALTTSCAMNKQFFQPFKMPESAKRVTINRGTPDSTVVYFTGNNHQPIFIKNGNDTVSYDYTIESVLFKSNDGNTLNGWMLKPKNSIANTTILHLHGNGGMLLSQYEAIAPLTKFGYQIFMFDYSGFGYSTGKPSRDNALADANSALDYILKREDVKGAKVLVYGQSLGGHLSAVLAAQRQENIQALVIEGAFSSHKDVAQRMAGKFGRAFVKEGYSAKVAIKNYRKPVLIIHSINDKTIPFVMGKTIYQNANEPKYFYQVNGEHIHAVIDNADSVAYKINMLLL